MNKNKQIQFEVWAQFRVAKKSVLEIEDFFVEQCKISPEFLIPNLHLTIYHSRRPMPDIEEIFKSCHLSIDTLDTRFMVLAPGGENPREELVPGKRKVGIRIHKASKFRETILKYRELFFLHETPKVLGLRRPSSKTKNAFGARNFQPHIGILKSGSGIQTDLTEIGDSFRDVVQEIHFDRFLIQKRRNF
jgi:hypothetical protein